MKSLPPFAFLLILTSICSAVNLVPSQFMDGSVSRDVPAAVKKGIAAGKPIVIITYDATEEDKSSPHSVSGFFGEKETRKLLAANFVQVMVPWTAKGVEQYRDLNDKTRSPSAIFVDKDGKVFRIVRFNYNAADALKIVQEVVAKIAATPAAK